MSKKITLTIEELEHEITQAFVHGQGNAIMIETTVTIKPIIHKLKTT